MNYKKSCAPEHLLLTAVFGAHAFYQSIPRETEQLPQKQVVRMRGIDDTIAYIKRTDADTAVTYGFIRKLIDNKELSSIRAGRKILINLDELTAYLTSGGRL